MIAKDDRFVALDGLARLLLDLAARHDKPMVVSVNAGRYYADFVSYRLGRKAPA